MRKRKLRFGFVAAALLVILGLALTGCGIWETLAEAARGRNTSLDGYEAADVKTKDDRRKIFSERLKIAPVELDVEKRETGNYMEVTLGSLRLFLPEGWEFEQRQEEGVSRYVLSDIHSQCESEEITGHKDGYQHEIVITPYEISQMPELSLQLAEEIKAYFPIPVLKGVRGAETTDEISGCWLYGYDGDREENEYFLFSETARGEKELFHVRESAITGYQNDVEAFDEFMEEGLVWINGGEDDVPYKSSNEQMEYYYLFNGNTDEPLFVVMHSAYREEPGKIFVYRKGFYETAITELSIARLYSGRIGIRDMNGDGYEDILCEGWLLNSGYSLGFIDDEFFEGYLWDEEQKSFVYISGEQMLAKYGDVWEGRRYNHERLENDNPIPASLSEYLSGYILKSKEELRDVMTALVSDRELTIEEVKELAKDNIAIKNELLSITSISDGVGIWLAVDADNDGIEDIFLCEYMGGSLGSVYYYLFAGQEDGGYELTDCQEELKKEFAFINWEGRNYLAKTTWEFTKKVFDGISLEYYESGSYQGGVWLSITPQSGADASRIETSYVKEECHHNLEEKLQELSGSYNPEESISSGTAESVDEEADYPRSSDLDNDGESETYRLSLWQTTNYYTVDHLQFSTEEDEISQQVQDILYEDGGIPKELWVDHTEYGNVIYVLYEDGLYDFHISGYRILNGETEKLIQVDCKVQTQVTPQIINRNGMPELH